MKTEPQVVIDGLADLVMVIKGDRSLNRWFKIISRRTGAGRAISILSAAQGLACAGVDATLVASLKLLTDPQVFDAARVALET